MDGNNSRGDAMAPQMICETKDMSATRKLSNAPESCAGARECACWCVSDTATTTPRSAYLERRPPRLLAVAAVEFRSAHKPLDGLGEVRHLLRAGVVAVALESAQVRVAEVVERASVLAKLGEILLEVLDVAACGGGREMEQTGG